MVGKITTWKQFVRKIRTKNHPLLSQATTMEDMVFVTGCQRSGTTMVTDLFRQSADIAPYQTNLDSELEGALVLCGLLPPHPAQRQKHCFQITYLNDRYQECFDHIDRFRLVYVVRNPVSVVYSMIHHWSRILHVRNFALNDLFLSCGKNGLLPSELRRFRISGSFGFTNLRKACLNYNEKTSQLFTLVPRLNDKMMVIEYDMLVKYKDELLPRLFTFVNLPYEPSFADYIRTDSLRKGTALALSKQKIIKKTCQEIYEQAAALAIMPN